LAEVITFLKNRDFSQFYFGTTSAQIVTEETEEIYVYSVSDHGIPDETVKRMLDVLEHLHDYLQKAYDQILQLDLKNDKHFFDYEKKLLPDEPDRVFTLNGIEFGIINANDYHPHAILYKPLCQGHKPKKDTDGFLLSLDTGNMFFEVKFSYEDMRPYAIVAWVVI
jgi:hypothetical protein